MFRLSKHALKSCTSDKIKARVEEKLMKFSRLVTQLLHVNFNVLRKEQIESSGKSI